MKNLYECCSNIEMYQDIKTDLLIKGDVVDPKLTIFIPTYKRDSTLEITIKSVVSQQTTQNFEIVIVNNNPDEGYTKTKELVEKIGDRRIYYYVNRQNIGACGNWNRGFELSRGTYVSMIHDDDLLGPYYVDSILAAIEKNPNVEMFGVGYHLFDSKNEPSFVKPDDLSFQIISRNSFFFESYLNIAGMTVKKDLWYKIGGFSEDFSPVPDTVFIYQALLKSRAINIRNELVGYRKEFNDSLSPVTMTNVIIMKEKIRRNIAQQEFVPRVWMKVFDKEYIYHYTLCANNYWELDINPELIMDRLGFEDVKISNIKMIIMRLLLKVARRLL